MHAAPTAVRVTSAHRDQSDPLGKFTKHRVFNRPIVQALMSDAGTRDIGRAIANCATRLSLDIPLEGDVLGEPLLRGARLCNRRLCPFCEWRRTRALRARLIAGLNVFASEQPKWSGVFLTLTVRNCQLHELRDTVQHMHHSLSRLTKTVSWPTEYWLRRTEITVETRGGRLQSVHPHLHCLLLVRPSYWGKGYVKQLEWQKQWQMAARLDYAPVIDVRRAKAKPQDDHLHGVAPVAAVVEAAKYVSKASDLMALGPDLPAFNAEVKGLRLYGVSRPLQRYISSADVTAEELLDTDRFPVPCITPAFSAVAQWFDESQDYRFVA